MPRTGQTKRLARDSDIEAPREAVLDVATIEPNALRDRAYKALSLLSFDERGTCRDKLLDGLEAAGVDIGSALLILGIPARTADELTPPELATLMRYLRINQPKAIEAIAPQLSELLTSNKESKQRVQTFHKAA